MITTIAKTKVSFIENIFIKKGIVLDVRVWKPAGMYEVDLHLPHSNVSGWTKAQKISCRVSPFNFRDYSPCWWDDETKTCTLFIHAEHDGEGSRWVKNLQRDDALYYFNIESARHSPEPGKHLIMLGDETTIGHFNALEQLAYDDCKISGAIVFKEDGHQYQFTDYCKKLTLDALSYATNNYSSLKNWIMNFPVDDNCIFYLAGNHQLVIQLRKLLKDKGTRPNQIKALGFWH